MQDFNATLKASLSEKISILCPDFVKFNKFTFFENPNFTQKNFVISFAKEKFVVVWFENKNIPFGQFIQVYYRLNDSIETKKFIREKLGDSFDKVTEDFFFHDYVFSPVIRNSPDFEEEPIIYQPLKKNNFDKYSSELFQFKHRDIFEIESKLMLAASKEIVVEPPLLSYLGQPVIKKNTINLIQGQFGSFKSRLSSFFISMMLGKVQGEKLGFEKDPNFEVLSCLIDTERNTTEELPFAIQNIAKFTNLKFPKNEVFRCTSLKLTNRTERLESLKQFVEDVRKSTQKHIFLTLDVATDTIFDFNSIEESMALLDFLGVLVEEQNLTVMLIIHENPGTRKARGHLGSEAWNKVSAAFRIGVFRNKDGSESNLIELEFLKLRATKKLPKIYMKFCEKTLDFVLAKKNEVDAAKLVNEQKANIEDVVIEIESYFEYPNQKIDQKTLIKYLSEHFDASKGTIITRLKSIVDAGSELLDSDGVICFLKCHSSSGSATFYTLEHKLSADEEK
ncbi:MAG: hypothetical protein K9I84_16305 [Leadbetterella sp.]|nr:hypothetical protein [Leadbetterella sp.]